MLAAATLLESPRGIRRRKAYHLSQGEIYPPHAFKARPSELEIAYACGFLNEWKADSLVAIETISVLAGLTHANCDDAANALLLTAQKWGASNYLTLKIAYISEFGVTTQESAATFKEIDLVLGHSHSPFIRYTALEHIKPSISIFAVARRHTNLLIDEIDGDFRRFHSLNNLVATPISDDDCAAYMLRAVETSLLDTVRAAWIILILADRLPRSSDAIRRNLDPDLLEAITEAHTRIASIENPLQPAEGKPDPTNELTNDEADEVDDWSLALYRRSIAFLEFPDLCKYCNDIDMVVGRRLVSPLLPKTDRWTAAPFLDLDTITQENKNFTIRDHGNEGLQIDTFYRTYLFLRYIQEPASLAHVSGRLISQIFDQTMYLDSLLSEQELRTLHLNAPDDARPLVSVLALSMYRSKSSDPDVDFDFRTSLEDHILTRHAGDIPSFIDALIATSPQVANYLVGALDEITLQKMYQLVPSLVTAENIRREILTLVGIALNKIEYLVEADSIETRTKVSGLRRYFDASRMYVDSIAMRKWLSSNPSAYTEEYKQILPKLMATMSSPRSVTDAHGNESTVSLLSIANTEDYLIERMATEAFKEFCVNNEFGIESYLGRRIRHNTLHGVMTKPVDAVMQKPEYGAIIVGTPFGQALKAWESGYRVFIERLRREYLQFRTDSRPNALFSSDLDISDPTTRRNLSQLSQTLGVSGTEMLEDLIIAFCWRQATPQLDSASRTIRVRLGQEITQGIDHDLQKFNGPEEIKVRTALIEGVGAVFGQVAGWFQVPQTGFVPASIPEICNIIDLEHGRSTPTRVVGEGVNKRFYGISVHRLYDCLAVLLQNAFKHGGSGSAVVVSVKTRATSSDQIAVLDVSVLSRLPDDKQEECLTRLRSAMDSSETGKDMVTEGYSGIKKVKFITRLNEGVSTVGFLADDDSVEVYFTLKAEVADVDAE